MRRCSDRRRRGQSSLEFAVLAGMFMVMFMIFFFIISDRMVAFQEEREQRIAHDVIYKVQNEFNLALKVHDGYNRTFCLPLQLYGRPYVIQLLGSAQEIEVEYDSRTYVQPIFVNLTADSQVVTGRNRIQKYQGNITVWADTVGC